MPKPMVSFTHSPEMYRCKFEQINVFLDGCRGELADDATYYKILKEREEFVNWLKQKFGDVGTELFISLIIREKFDYTRWRRQFFGDKTVSEINEEAAEYSRNHPFKPQKPLASIKREG